MDGVILHFGKDDAAFNEIPEFVLGAFGAFVFDVGGDASFCGNVPSLSEPEIICRNACAESRGDIEFSGAVEDELVEVGVGERDIHVVVIGSGGNADIAVWDVAEGTAGAASTDAAQFDIGLVASEESV